MGQAASYAESSVQRALLRLKHEEQAEETELLLACGYRKPSASPAPSSHHTTPPREREGGTPPPPGTSSANGGIFGGSAERQSSSASSSPLPAPPDCFGPFVSLEPAYYSLDELRDALRYLPDTLWVSLYRVSLLYILDNDHDGRVRPTDINLFMDWSIKTVGRDVPPEQLAEVLQTHAALHCWHRCLHVGEELEAERAAAAQQSGRGGAANSAAARNRRRPLPAGGVMSGGLGGGGGSASPHHHHQPQAPSVSSFMLLHLREAFFSSRPGGPVPLPSNAPARSGVAAGPAAAPPAAAARASGGIGGADGLSSPLAAQFFSPRSAVTQPVTAATRLEAAAHFAEWMLRLVQNQERDRRHERQRFERRLRCLTSTAEARSAGTLIRHSQLLQHHTMRLRGGSLAMLPLLSDGGGAAVDAEDVMTSHSGMPLRGAGVDVSDSTEAEMVTMMAPRLSLPDTDVVRAAPTSTSPVRHVGNSPGKLLSSPFARSLTPPGGSVAVAKTQREERAGEAVSAAAAAKARPLASDTPPLQYRPQEQQRMSMSSRAMPCFASALTATQSEDNVLLGSQRKVDGGEGQSSFAHWASPSQSGGGAAPALLSAVLMDSEAFYVELERNGWCTIGAVEEAYLDFAVEDSYCLSFWAFCRLLNESSAGEVEAALELTTAQATAVLTSAAAVEDFRRNAALRQLQRLQATTGPHRTASQPGAWEAQLEVVPVFIVSEYTYVTFVTAFIHAYWDMLESMGIEAVTQPADMTPATAGHAASAGLRA